MTTGVRSGIGLIDYWIGKYQIDGLIGLRIALYDYITTLQK
jgi:hypothetical protein